MSKSLVAAILIIGVESVKVSYRPPEGTVPWHKKISSSSWNDPDWKIDYFVPNFGGQEVEVSDTQDSLKASEKKLKHQLGGGYPYTTFEKPDGFKKDYFVPQFGLDEDVLATQDHIAFQEKTHGVWTPTQDDNGAWNVPGAADNKSYSYGV